jgi:prepilin signal peptidase PulO-like enzyme (type II secretory pathway)
MTKTTVLVGLIGAATFALLGLLHGADDLAFARLIVVGAALGAVTAVDLRERRIPNRITLPAAAICALLAGPEALRHSLLALALVGVLLLLAFAQPAALGMGDVKQALLISLALGAAAVSALLLGVLFAAAVGIIVVVCRGRAAITTALPLAPFLAAGAVAALALT